MLSAQFEIGQLRVAVETPVAHTRKTKEKVRGAATSKQEPRIKVK